MYKRNRALWLAMTSGLAISAAASAQPFMIVNNQPGTWTEIRPTGTLVSTQGNNYIDYFTSSVTNALVTTPDLITSTDGWVIDWFFNMNPSGAFNQPLPVSGGDGGIPERSMAFGLFPFWDDVVGPFPFTATGGVWHKHVVEGGINVEVVEWYQVHENGFAGPLGSFQLKIFETGPILAQYIYNYSDPNWCGSGAGQGPSNLGGTIGVQWPTGYFQHSYNTSSISPGTVLSIVNNPVNGACCMPDGSCYLDTASGWCASRGGTFSGVGSTCASANCPQPPTGACCTDAGCSIKNQIHCLAETHIGAQGEYHGDNSSCGSFNCSPNLINNGGFERLLGPEWFVSIDDGFAYPQNSVLQRGGYSLVISGPSSATSIRQTISAHQGDQLAVSFWYQAQGSGNEFLMMIGGGSQGVWSTVADFINDTSHTSWTQFSYTLTAPCDNPDVYISVSNYDLTYLDSLVVSVVPAQAPCYPNCDASTASPVLNVADFTCFLQKYAAGNPYANCDVSTTQPELNVADFTCFLQKYAAGCR